MIELTFIMGGEIMKFRIEGKKIEIKGKGSNYEWLEWNPLNMSANNLAKLRIKYGEKWFRDYIQSEKEFEEMETEEQMADSLEKDFKKTGWRLALRK